MSIALRILALEGVYRKLMTFQTEDHRNGIRTQLQPLVKATYG
jgi:hypothetical protein